MTDGKIRTMYDEELYSWLVWVAFPGVRQKWIWAHTEDAAFSALAESIMQQGRANRGTTELTSP